MTEAEKNEIVGLVMTKISSQAVDFDINTEQPQANDLLTAVRETESGGYRGVTIKWDDVARIATELANQAVKKAEQAKTDAVNAKNIAQEILTGVQNKGTELTNFVATSKSEIETQKNESVNAVRNVYQTDLNELKGDLANLFNTNNRLSGCEKVENAYFSTTEEANSNYSYFKNILVTSGTTYNFNILARFVTFFYSDGTKTIVEEVKTCVIPENCNMVYVTFYNKDISIAKMAEDGVNLDDVFPLNEYTISSNIKATAISEDVKEDISKELIKKCPSKNLIDYTKSTDGHISDNQGNIESNKIYRTTDFIYVEYGKSYTISPRERRVLFYTNDRIAIPESLFDAEKVNYVFTPSQNGYVRITYYKKDEEKIQLEEGTEPTIYAPFSIKKFEEDVSLSNFMIEQIKELNGNILYGKKWVSCGDSFTQGDFNGILESEYTLSNGKYKGYKKVYPYFIGNRNQMEIVNEAVSGSTMAYLDGNTSEFSTENGRYTKIPLDADYITLYFGINDSHNNIPIGNIDDEVNTTFYGAWNIVMRYLITNYPYAKIGIIVSNGCDSADYPNATIAIAKKWGVSYLDLDGDYKVPMMLRTVNRSETCSEAKELRMNQFKCSSTNYHPNPKAHEYESTFIENWLRSL